MTFDVLILKAIISIHNDKIRPDLNSIFDYINKELRNSDITYTWVETRLSFLTVDGKLDITYPSGKISYWVRAESKQDLSSSKTVATLVVSPLICEMPILSLKESNVNNNLSLEERINLLNTEVITMQFFIVDHLLIATLTI